MKRQYTKWGKISDTWIINIGFVSRLYFKNYINQWEKDNLIKWAIAVNKHKTKRG